MFYTFIAAPHFSGRNNLCSVLRFIVSQAPALPVVQGGREGRSTKKYFSQVQRPTLPFLPVAVAFRPIGLSWFLALSWPILYSICGGQDNLTFHSLCWFVAHFYPYRDQNTACHLPDISVSYIVPGGEKLCRAVSCSVY